MNISHSDLSLYPSRHAKRLFAQVLVALAVFGANCADAQTWEYRPGWIGSSRDLSPGTVTFDEKGGKTTLTMVFPHQEFCSQGVLDATAIRTDTTTTITVTPRVQGCDEIRFVIKNDGTGGRRELKKGSDWVWDGFDRGLILSK